MTDPAIACTCDPSRPYSNVTGHHIGCATHARILSDYDAGTPPAPEDRGTPHWAWVAGSVARFEPFDGAEMVVEMSVPIGWQFVPDVGCGVALRGPYFERLTAGQAWGLAAAGGGGFKVRSTGTIGG